jgi:predicted DNA-binding transcriptional regulator AlpA
MGRRDDITLGRLVMQYTIPEIGFVRLREVLTVIPIGKSCWWEGVKSGRFPKPVKLSARCTAWRAEDIRVLITQISKSSAETPN